MWTCPKCLEDVDDDFDVCWQCGTNVDGVVDQSFKPEIEGEPPKYRPWFISPHPIASRCPQCGDGQHTKAKPGCYIAFVNDCVCRTCGVQYTPPTPMWAALLFLALGSLVVIGALLDSASAISVVWRGDLTKWPMLALDSIYISAGALLIAYGAVSTRRLTKPEK
jgi:uncharacterized protein (DUF983 family)